jgi:hypothetical protein
VQTALADRELVEIDLMVALALARASTTALLNLSPLSYREVCAALREELARLQLDGDRAATAASALLRQIIPSAELR